MSRFLVTGGAGFIGSNLVEYLLNRGYEVTVLDKARGGDLRNLSGFLAKIRLVKGDVREKEKVDEAVAGCDYVLHHAAVSLVGPTIKDPLQANEVNVKGTLNVLQAARENKVKRFVQASSAAVYGNSEGTLRKEDDGLAPLSPYAVAKLAAEYYAQVYYHLYDLETVSLRYFNVYGPRQDSTSEHASALAIFVSKLVRGEVPVIHGDGKQSRDFVYVEDVCEANLRAALTDNKNVPGSVYNIGSGRSTTIKELLQVIQKVVGVSEGAGSGRGREGDVRFSRADVSKARRDLGWQPKTSLPKGIERFVQWYEAVNAAAEQVRG